MSAPRPLTPATTTRTTPLESLMVYANTLAASARADEAETVLREAMTIEPDDPAPYHALLSLILRDGRDVEAFAFVAMMLARLAPPSSATLREAAQAMVTLHARHAHLLGTREEPHRLQLAPIGVLDPTPFVMAPEFLKRARALARTAVQRGGHDGANYLLLSECELHAGNSTAARVAAERAVDLATPEDRASALLARAISAFADYREGRGLELLGAPRLTESFPSLGTGQLIAADIDPDFAPDRVESDASRAVLHVPYRVVHHESLNDGDFELRVAPPVAATLVNGRVIGGEWIALGHDDRAFVHGVTQLAPRQLGMRELSHLLTEERNRLLWRDTDRLLVHAPRLDREHPGRAVLLGGPRHGDWSSWLLETLGRLSAVPELLLDPDVRFIVPEPLADDQLELLAWLGIGVDRLAPVADDEVVAFEELIIVRHRSHGECVSQESIAWLRDALSIPRIFDTPHARRRLFLRSAVKNGTRLLINEAEVERACASFGFECVDAESLSLEGRRDLFADASVVVTTDQPLLANLLFAPAGTRAVILAPRSFARARHAALAHTMGQEATYVLGAERPTRATYPDWEYAVDVADVRCAIRGALA